MVSDSPVQRDRQHVRQQHSEWTFHRGAVKQKVDHFPPENVLVNTGHVFMPSGHSKSSKGKRSYSPDG